MVKRRTDERVRIQRRCRMAGLWPRAYEPTLCQATVVVRPMRQHSCHRAAAWSTAGALVDGNGRRAGRSRARRAGAGAIRRLPRCAAPRHTSSIGTQHVRPYRVAHGCAGGWPASGSILGTNSRATQRAGELAAADPAYRARLGRRLELAARSRPEILLCGASFGHALERALVRGKLVGCGAIQRDVRRLCDAP